MDVRLHAAELADLVYESQVQSKRAGDLGRRRSQAGSESVLPFGDVLPRRAFLKQLQIEQRRTDRSKMPLSIALFRFDKRHGMGDVKSLLDLLSDSKRETDVLGYLQDDLVGVLLTETNDQGAQDFTRKIADRTPEKVFSTFTRTYPGQHLGSLIEESAKSPSPSFAAHEDRERDGYQLKRVVDIIGSIIAIVLLSPVMLLTAFAIAVTSRGPIVLKQVRLGRNGVPFVFYKFRSMRVRCDDKIHREYIANLIKGDLETTNQGNAARPLYKMKSDPRVTKVGRIIRKTSIDELPQLFNVLNGEMSLVGPRPPLPYEAEHYQSWHLRRVLEAKPGMTGLWQVEGRSKTSFDEMVRMDLRYVQCCSLIFDLKILLKTMRVVFRCEGAR